MIPFGLSQNGIINSSAGLFDVEPYRNPNHDEQSPQEQIEHYTEFIKNQYGNNGSGSSSSLVNDSGNSAIEKLANDLNVKLDSSSKDYLLQYYLADKASQAAYDRELKAAGSQYQRTVADLRKAGLNPFLAFDSLRGGSVSSSAGSITGGLYTSKSNQKTQSGAQTASAIISVLGIIAAAAMHFLL